MNIYSGVTQFKIPENTVVTFGKFDGIHMGHMALINTAAKIAKENNLKLCIFTFDILPSISMGRFDASLITTNYEKRNMFKEAGVDYLVEFPFNESTKNLEPLTFIEKIIIGALSAKYLVVGSDWRFAVNRSGDCNTLIENSERFGYQVHVVEKELFSGQEISSTWIRKEIEEGNMENVNILLGYPYMVMGTVSRGRSLGRDLGFPTINIYPPSVKILPPNGVYASKVKVGSQEYYSITNVGVRPTVEDTTQVSVETYIFNFNGDLYNQEVTVEFFHYLRPEMKFDTIEKLVTQIESDKEFVKTFFLI